MRCHYVRYHRRLCDSPKSRSNYVTNFVCYGLFGPLGVKKTLLTCTSILFFIVNLIKLVPNAPLGQRSIENLVFPAALLPLAPLGIWIGLKLHGIVSQELFYLISYVMMMAARCKLGWVGLSKGGYFKITVE